MKVQEVILRGISNQISWIEAAEIIGVSPRTMRRWYLYLVEVMDWVSRCVLAWQLSNTPDSRFCVNALESALAGHANPKTTQIYDRRRRVTRNTVERISV